jgi:hypothetical protein
LTGLSLITPSLTAGSGQARIVLIADLLVERDQLGLKNVLTCRVVSLENLNWPVTA